MAERTIAREVRPRPPRPARRHREPRRRTELSGGWSTLTLGASDDAGSPARDPLQGLVADLARSATSPLPLDVRARAQQRLGVGVLEARVHQNAAAEALARHLGVLAATFGRDVALARELRRGEERTDEILFHELVHVTQQRGALPATDVVPAESAVEDEARATTAEDFAEPPSTVRRHPRSLAAYGPTEAPVPASSESQRRGVLGGIESPQWMRAHGTAVAAQLELDLRETTLRPSVTELSWRADGRRRFAAELLSSIGSDPASVQYMLGRLLQPDSLRVAVDTGRDCYPSPLGPPGWADGVPTEILARLNRRLTESMTRVAPRLAQVLELEARRVDPTPASGSNGATTLGIGSFVWAQEAPTRLLSFPHPLDPLLFLALHDAVELDLDAYRERVSGIAEADLHRQIRRVRFVTLAQRGVANWIRVTEPADATPEEVAFELFADTTLAHTLVDARPLFGVQLPPSEPGSELWLSHLGIRPEHRSKFSFGLTPAGRIPTVTARSPIEIELDPVQTILESPAAEEAALRSASDRRPTSGLTRDAMLLRLSLIVTHLGELERTAPQLSRDPSSPTTIMIIDRQAPAIRAERYVDEAEQMSLVRLTNVKARLVRRLARLATAPTPELLEWDQQTAAQLQILGSCVAGLRTAVAVSSDFAGWPRVHHLVRDVALRYIAAAEASELARVGQERLARADEASQMFPVHAMELLLAELRRTIDEARTDKLRIDTGSPTERYGLQRFDEQAQQLRVDLAAIRPTLLQNPAAGSAQLQAIYERLADLQIGVTLVANLDALDAAWRALYDATSVVGELRAMFGHSGNDLLREAMAHRHRLSSEWHAIYLEWRFGDKDEARRQLERKARSREWRTYFNSLRQLITDHQGWDALVTFTAMVGIALLTAGIGAYVTAGATAAWGTGAGFIAGTLTEAALFTVMSYPLVAQEGSLSEFGTHFMANVGIFAVLKSVSMGYRALIGSRAAATTLGGLGEIGVQFGVLNSIALVAADAQKREETGEGLSTEEMTRISLHNLAFIAVVALGARVGRSRFVQLQTAGRLRGLQHRVNAEHGRLDATLGEARAAIPREGQPVDQVRVDELALRLDAEIRQVVEAEQRLAEAIETEVRAADRETPDAGGRRLERLGIDVDTAGAARRGELATEASIAEVVLEAARVQRLLEPLGQSGDFLVGAESFDAVVAHYRAAGATVVDASSPFGGPEVMEVLPSGSRAVSIRPAEGPAFRVIQRPPVAAEVVGGTPGGSATTARPARAAVELTPGRRRAYVQLIEALTARNGVLRSHPLTPERLARVIEKGPDVNQMKGQLLEELISARIEQMVQSEAGIEALGLGGNAPSDLVFIEGHRITDLSGRQITDGIIARREGATYRILLIIEAKAGQGASAGLSRSSGSIRRMSRADKEELFGLIYETAPAEVEAMVTRRAPSSLADVQARRFGQLDATVLDMVNTSRRVRRLQAGVTTTEVGGQITRDVERLYPALDESTTTILVDRAETSITLSPTRTKFLGVVPESVRTERIQTSLRDAGYDFRFETVDISARNLVRLTNGIRDGARANGLMPTAP